MPIIKGVCVVCGKEFKKRTKRTRTQSTCGSLGYKRITCSRKCAFRLRTDDSVRKIRYYAKQKLCEGTEKGISNC